MAKKRMFRISYHGKRRHGFLRWIFGAIFAVLLIGLVLGLFAFAGAFGHFTPVPYSYHWPFFFFPFGFLIFIFAAFFIFRFVFWGWGWGWGRGYYRGSWAYNGPYALDVLNQRYARGEITKEQYDQMKSDILRKE